MVFTIKRTALPYAPMAMARFIAQATSTQNAVLIVTLVFPLAATTVITIQATAVPIALMAQAAAEAVVEVAVVVEIKRSSARL